MSTTSFGVWNDGSMYSARYAAPIPIATERKSPTMPIRMAL